MQNAATKQNATLAMAFLFVSLIVTPLSLKAIGISPNLSAGVEAWRHIAGIITGSQQPINAADVLALNSIPDVSPQSEPVPGEGGLLASAQPLSVALTDELTIKADDRAVGNPVTSVMLTRRCGKASNYALRAKPTAPMAMAAVMPVEGIGAGGPADAGAAKIIMPIRKEAIRRYEQAMATYRVDLREAMKFVPKDFKVTVKVKAPVFTKPPMITTCDVRRVFSPEKMKQLHQAGWSLPSEDASEFTEKSEL